jgi:NAD(P)-dependent dehydrogenase (short-subunit alcohol dehydrogenase family)
MSIADKTILVTGAGRGIGQALTDEALRRGARRVYAAARRPSAHPDERVTPLRMDVTDAAEAFLPALTRSGGAIVNNLSLNSLAPLPALAAYSVSKAAAFSLTQSLRTSLAGRGVRVHAVLTGPTDTDMVRDLDIPKASAESVARAIFDAVDRGEEDIFPDPLAQSLADGWRNGAVKAFERQLAQIQ